MSWTGTLTDAVANEVAALVIASAADNTIRPNDRITLIDESAQKTGTRIYTAAATATASEADAADFSGKPPTPIIERGLMLELTEGMWIHEALRSRLLREVGVTNEIRLKKLKNARLRHMPI